MKIQMIEETKKAGNMLSVIKECGIFMLLFVAASTLQSIVTIGPMLYEMVSSGFINKMMENSINGSYSNIMEMALEIMSSDIVVIATFFSTIAIIGVIIFYCRKIRKRSYASMGIVREKWGSSYLLGILYGLAFLCAVYGGLALFGCVETVEVGSFKPVIIVIIIGIIIQSASEEIMMRGYFMNAVAAKSSIIIAIILNSVIFMFLHVVNPGVTVLSLVNILIYGVIFSLLCLVTDNIWVVCGMHFSWNAALGCLFGSNISGINTPTIFRFVLSGEDYITGGNFGIEGSIITTFIGVAIVLFLSWRLYNRKLIGDANV